MTTYSRKFVLFNGFAGLMLSALLVVMFYAVILRFSTISSVPIVSLPVAQVQTVPSKTMVASAITPIEKTESAPVVVSKQTPNSEGSPCVLPEHGFMGMIVNGNCVQYHR